MALLDPSLEKVGGLEQDSGEHARAHAREEVNCKPLDMHPDGAVALNGHM